MDLQEGIDFILGSNPNYELFDLVANEPINVEPVTLSTSFLEMANEFLMPDNIVSEKEMLQIDPNYRGVDTSLKPKKLTEDDVESLLSHFENVDCIDRETSEIITEQYRQMFANILLDADIAMVPAESASNLFIEMSNRKMAEALSTHGERYGGLGAFALSCAETQVSLKLRKTTVGGKSMVMKNNIEYIKGIFHARKRPNRSYTDIHFNRKMSQRELVDFSYQLRRVSVENLLTKTRYRIGQLTEGDIEPGITHRFHVNEKTHYPKVYCIRLFFDKDKLFAHRLTPYDISTLLQANNIIGENTRITPSPFEEGYIDVVSKLAMNLPDQGPNEYVSDLKFVIYPKIKNYQLQGIVGIEDAVVQRVGYHSFFQTRLRKPNKREREEYPGDYLILRYDLTAMANSMQPNLAFVEDSLQKAGVLPKTGAPHRFVTKLGKRVYGYPISTTALNRRVKSIEFVRRFSAYVEEIKLREGKFVIKANENFATVLRKEGYVFESTETGYLVEVPMIRSLGDAFAYLNEIDSHYCYISAEGSFADAKSNILRGLSVFPEIDFSRFTTNSLPYMNKFFGIEATRNYEIYAIAENQRAKDSRSQPRFTVLLADHTSFYGEPLGTDFYQNARKKDNDFVIIGDNSHSKQIFDSYANRGSSALPTTTSALVLTSGRMTAGRNITPTINATPESVLASLRQRKTTERITSVGIAERLNQRIENAIEEIGSRPRTVEVEALTIKPPLLSDVTKTLYEPLLAKPSEPQVDVDVGTNNFISPYAEGLQIEIPCALSPLAPVVFSMRPVQILDVIALIQRTPQSPFQINLENFSIRPKKKQIVYGARLASSQVEDEGDLFFNPLDFLRVPSAPLIMAEDEITAEDLKSYF